MSDDVPVFVVVGNVNQGKSSIVATLSEDPTVPIASHPGTTRKSGDYVFSSGDRPLFKLIDTPGFQEARAVLAWMQERSFSALDHPDTVRAFVDEHGGDARFQDEVRLLRPVLDGASVIYVVDASGPPQPSNEAEMEILRWTGRPGMALVNRTRERDHASEWRPYLEQFFNVVREFDAHGAGFSERMELLRSFRAIRDEWRVALDESIEVMEREWTNRRARAATVIAEAVVRMLAHVERRRLPAEGDPTDLDRRDLETAYLKALRGFEADARVEIENVYRHRRVARSDDDLALHDADLFSDVSWRAFGLTRAQLAQYGVAWGLAIGAAIDMMVGGFSFFLGAAIGAAAGGIAGFLGGTRVARAWGDRSKLARTLFPGEHGRFMGMGPATNPRFAWMVVDRSLVHFRAARDRAHASKDPLDLSSAEPSESKKRGVVATLDSSVRGELDRTLQKILKQAVRGSVSDDTEVRLRGLLKEIL
ncbi:MAG: GTPase [Deltaproteobacteria bacterium]|nr:GTPase [Deltaproteobacteria bacterium]